MAELLDPTIPYVAFRSSHQESWCWSVERRLTPIRAGCQPNRASPWERAVVLTGSWPIWDFFARPLFSTALTAPQVDLQATPSNRDILEVHFLPPRPRGVRHCVGTRVSGVVNRVGPQYDDAGINWQVGRKDLIPHEAEPRGIFLVNADMGSGTFP